MKTRTIAMLAAVKSLKLIPVDPVVLDSQAK